MGDIEKMPRGRLPKIAPIAATRKLLIAVYHVSKDRRPFIAARGGTCGHIRGAPQTTTGSSQPLTATARRHEEKPHRATELIVRTWNPTHSRDRRQRPRPPECVGCRMISSIESWKSAKPHGPGGGGLGPELRAELLQPRVREDDGDGSAGNAMARAGVESVVSHALDPEYRAARRRAACAWFQAMVIGEHVHDQPCPMRHRVRRRARSQRLPRAAPAPDRCGLRCPPPPPLSAHRAERPSGPARRVRPRAWPAPPRVVP